MRRKFVLPIALIVGGFVVSILLVGTRPEPGRAVAPEMSELVRVLRVEQKRRPVRVVGHGTVIPAEEITLQPEVAGTIVEKSGKLIAGSFFGKGELLARIDPKEFELAVRQKDAEVARAEVELRLEAGRQRVAEREWELLGEEIPTSEEGRELALRKPQVANARAGLRAARASLDRARLDLERTGLRAPFNAVVIEASADLGQRVAPGFVLARLAGTDRVHVQVSLPVERLSWIDLPARDGTGGSAARVVADAGIAESIERGGQVVRMLGDLEPQGRLARVLVEVEDPFGLGEENATPVPLLLGSYVRVEITGKQVENVFEIPRKALRENDEIWVAGAEDRLEIRPVEVTWRGENHVFLRHGLEAGDRVVTSRIGTAVPGMSLRIEEEAGS